MAGSAWKPRDGTEAPSNRRTSDSTKTSRPVTQNPIGIVEAKNFGGWCVLANVWRDFRLTDQLDLYGGGGIGGTGFETSFQ